MINSLKDAIYCSVEKKGFRMHPGGFYQLGLDDGNSELHIWPIADEATKEAKNFIHDHNYFLRSMVLIGGLTQKGYNLVKKVDGDYHVLNVSRSQIPGYRNIDLTGIFGSLEENLSATMHGGEVHNLTAGTLHKSMQEGTELTATLIKKVDQKIAPTRLLVPRGQKLSRQDLSIFPTEQRIVKSYLEQVLQTVSEEAWDDAHQFVNYESTGEIKKKAQEAARYLA